MKNFNSNHEVYKEIMKAVQDFGPDIVGISFMTANSASGYYLAEMLKIIIPNCLLLPEELTRLYCPKNRLKGRLLIM